MVIEFLQENLNKILVGSGTSIAAIIAIVAACKKWIKPTVKSTRRSLKYIIKFLLANVDTSKGKYTCNYTLLEIQQLINEKELKWEEKKNDETA